ncbi:disease resistance protein RPM1-like [Ananas comosus]|uniref:Disease resistance protein RPM1-like n=1 Tax=Ananas comosus TaxID=4615 RepID=A0A6P5G991_ANACO|nr:disease resistance protein RPM1-like [Ananas comosus]
MAGAAVFHVLNKIAASLAGKALDTISSELVKEVSALLAIKNSMKQIESEFAVMQAYISQVNAHDSPNKPLVAWLEQVKNVAFEVEDIIDEYTYLVGEENVSGFRNSLKKKCRHLKNIAAWHGIADQLKQVETRLVKLTTMRDRYGISVRETASDFAALRQRRAFDIPYLSHEDEIVGNDEETKKLIEWLTDGKEARAVISISGMGGLGKTTLANNIFKNPTVKRHFNWSVWISVSQSYRVEDLLRRILTHNTGKNEEILNGIDTMDRIELAEKVQIYLREKRYLIVLDDVWSRAAWSLLDCAFVRNNFGSRVIITTRTEDVALLADENRRLRLSTLPKEEAWDLFCKKAFSRLAEKRCPQHLKDWAEKIVDKCRGLPLAVVAIGSLLSYREQQEQEWKSFYDQLSWQLTNNPELNWVASILNLSFNDLPGYLKNCFLYCSLFPEDYLIRRKWLIRLWTAEGFIEERGPETTMEEVADGYVKELVHRSMLQVVERNDFGRAKMLQIHDLVREITLTRSREEKFGIVCNGPGPTMLREQARRVSVHKGGLTSQPNANLRQLRSFILFDEELPSSSIENASSSFKLLRVLCLRHAKMEQIPDAVFNLFNLHYLDLRCTKVKSIPKSLGKLQNLQTLDLSMTRVEKLPREVVTLTKLRHLFVVCFYDYNCRTFDSFSAVSVPHDICRLEGLQTLLNIEADKFLMQNIGSLTSLRNLFVMKVRGAYCTELWASLKMMPGLVALGVVASDKDELLCLDGVHPLPSLQKLYLKGRLDEDEAPTVFANFGRLRDLRLAWSGLQTDPLHSFSHMSSLVDLHLYRVYEGQRLSFRAGWFPRLKNLFLADMAQVSVIDIEDGAMKSLYQLQLIGLSSLTATPAGVVYLQSLQAMYLIDMPQEFIRRLETSDRSKVQHIPNVYWRSALYRTLTEVWTV